MNHVNLNIMPSNSSSIDADDLDVDEGAVVQSAQPSIF
jgi:hypothetical protein